MNRRNCNRFKPYKRQNRSVGTKRRLSIQQQYDRVIEMCTTYLAEKLTVWNAIDMIFFARNHRMTRLQATVALFIDVNHETVFTSDEFLELNIDQIIALSVLLIYNEMSSDNMENAILLWTKYQRTVQKKQHNFIR